MIDTTTRNALERMALTGAGDAGALAQGLRRQVTGVGLRALAAKMLHVAICSPSRMADVYDNAANGWLSGPVFVPNFRGVEALDVSDAFWRAFWAILDVPAQKRRPAAFTVEAMRLSGLLNPQLNVLAAASAAEVRGVMAAAANGVPAPFNYDLLEACPASSLGGMLRLEMAARGQTGEMFDRAELGLADLPPPLDFLNTQALQCHVLWAVIAGYSAAQLDEIALSAFQMGQFRHPFSALVVGMTMATVALDRPPGLELVLDSIFRGWEHGRRTPLLLGIDWAALMPLPIETVRERLGVTKFPSPLSGALRQWARGVPPSGE